MKPRVHMIHDAASHLFINKGYSRTQMKDIAHEIRLSTGMLYVYFYGKKDILNFILKATVDPSILGKDWDSPVSFELPGKLEDEIVRAFTENDEQFSRHLGDVSAYPLDNMLSEAFDIISKYGVGCLLIEKNPNDVGMLAGVYEQYRKKLFSTMHNYVQAYIERGSFRKVEHVEYTIQLIVETLSWWGMHVMNDAFEVQKDIPLGVAKQVCLDNLLHAYRL